MPNKCSSRAVQILDFWGPYAKLCCCRLGGGGFVQKNGCNAFVHVSLHLESRSRKALEKQYLFRGSVCFQLVFLVSSKTLYNIHVTWFDWFLCREGDSAPH